MSKLSFLRLLLLPVAVMFVLVLWFTDELLYQTRTLSQKWRDEE